MCLIAWNWQPHSQTPLVLLSNRDEFYARPARALDWWSTQEPDASVLGGRDLQAGGTWLGVNKYGHLAAITNYRNVSAAHQDVPSRGELVASFLQGRQSAPEYLKTLADRAERYSPFNLLVFDGQCLMGLESRQAKILHLPTGIGGVSNADFHTPWPKLVRLQNGLQELLQSGSLSTATALELLHDTTLAHDGQLPATGVALAVERLLSPIFVSMPGYETRACSVVRLHHDRVDFDEQTVNDRGPQGTKSFSFSRPTI